MTVAMIEALTSALSLVTHLDTQLLQLTQYFGIWAYVILFGIIFAETGLVVMPFLPGDSLIFVAGTLAGAGYMHIGGLYVTLLAAAIIGDTTNYWIGHYIGPKVFDRENSRFFNKNHLEKTRAFYDKHGVKTIILARFVPIIRTFAPFVAGIGKMQYGLFMRYNMVGGFLWITLFTLAGYFFGGLSFVQENFHYVVVLIIAISLLPVLYEYIKYKREEKELKRAAAHTDFQDVVQTIEDAEEVLEEEA